LISESGAEVEVMVRAPQLRWLRGAVSLRKKLGPLGALLFPWTDVGSPPWNQLVAHPTLFRLLPDSARIAIDRITMAASVAGWVKPRIENVRISTSCVVKSAEQSGAQLKLMFDDGSTRAFDHVVLATGFKVDLARLPFLSRDLLGRIHLARRYPRLNAGFESSVPGLHFVGATAAHSFGSLTRFVAGTGYSAITLAAAVTRSARTIASSASRPETAFN
jgi:hypothetical protein